MQMDCARESSNKYGQLLAILAGICAASGSAFAKLIFYDYKSIICEILESGGFQSEGVCEKTELLLRGCTFLIVLVCNSLMWTLFVHSLQKCSSVVATVTNFAANFSFSAVLGQLFFGEPLNLMWGCGVGFIVCGVLLVHSSEGEEKLSKED